MVFTGRNQGDEYSMDENEAESERDKQAVLAGNDRDINGKNSGVWKWPPPNLPSFL